MHYQNPLYVEKFYDLFTNMIVHFAQKNELCCNIKIYQAMHDNVGKMCALSRNQEAH